MASTFKPLNQNDITTVRDMLHEAIPITGTIVSGTYNTGPTDHNIKNYETGLFQSVFDYPYLSSSANHIFDLTVGYSNVSSLSASAMVAGGTQTNKKINMYNEMAQILAGFDETGSVRRFDRDGDLTGGAKLDEVFIVNFARLLTKDEIKKQSFSMTLLTGSTVSTPSLVSSNLLIQDHGAQTSYKVNSPVGEYGILYTGSAALAGSGVGLIYYQAGICVLTASVFDGPAVADYIGNNGAGGETVNYTTVDDMLISGSISGSCDAFRNRLDNISFNNTTEINSTIYFCRANFNEYNYSSNPTYLSQSQIVVKTSPNELPRAFVTSVGLYSADNELLAVAKLSAPLQKDPTDELILRVRLDY
jgi:hypothetical protein